ncbi:hypothetical protein [Paenibacillus sp. Pae108]|uniref:hypothetical protein n=1 Tax=Paenibacillus sp. Pae108 TaxID=2926019 RepID=UPI0021197E33|nr:hypothetical protein [Paenibacillus sp. Pae108]
MAGLIIENEEQAAKAEAQRADFLKKARNPLLDETERAKLKKMADRLTQVIDAYRKNHPAPNEATAPPTGAIVLQEAAPPTRDPRPDLTDDVHLWADLLLMADGKDKEAGRIYGEVDTLCGVLNGFRCGGTRLRAGKSMWVLKPDIDPSGIAAWESQAEYDDFKARYLQQWGDVIPDLLKALTQKHPLPREGRP